MVIQREKKGEMDRNTCNKPKGLLRDQEKEGGEKEIKKRLKIMALNKGSFFLRKRR